MEIYLCRQYTTGVLLQCTYPLKTLSLSYAILLDLSCLLFCPWAICLAYQMPLFTPPLNPCHWLPSNTLCLAAHCCLAHSSYWPPLLYPICWQPWHIWLTSLGLFIWGGNVLERARIIAGLMLHAQGLLQGRVKVTLKHGVLYMLM